MLIVIIAMQVFSLIFGIDVNKEKERYAKEVGVRKAKNVGGIKEVSLDLVAFIFACVLGYFIGSIKIYLGSAIKFFSLGATGGILVASLVLGYIGKIGPLNFRMNSKYGAAYTFALLGRVIFTILLHTIV